MTERYFSTLINQNFRDPKGATYSSKYDIDLDTIEAVTEGNDENDTFDGNSMAQMKVKFDASILNPENRRLLPNSANGTHILEGPHNR